MLFRSATLTPCCDTSFCHECLHNSLADNDMLCPECESRIKNLNKLVVDDGRRERVKAYIDEVVEASKEVEEVKDEEMADREPAEGDAAAPGADAEGAESIATSVKKEVGVGVPVALCVCSPSDLVCLLAGIRTRNVRLADSAALGVARPRPAHRTRVALGHAGSGHAVPTDRARSQRPRPRQPIPASPAHPPAAASCHGRAAAADDERHGHGHGHGHGHDGRRHDAGDAPAADVLAAGDSSKPATTASNARVVHVPAPANPRSRCPDGPRRTRRGEDDGRRRAGVRRQLARDAADGTAASDGRSGRWRDSDGAAGKRWEEGAFGGRQGGAAGEEKVRCGASTLRTRRGVKFPPCST